MFSQAVITTNPAHGEPAPRIGDLLRHLRSSSTIHRTGTMWSLMIVDDEELIREGLRDLISWDQYGVRVVGEAAGGEEALRKTRTQRPDIIVTDVVMPDMNGLELVERLRSSGSAAKIVFISAYEVVEFLKSGYKWGALDYILKPIKHAELIAAVSRAVEALEKEADTRHELEVRDEYARELLALDLINGVVATNDDLAARPAAELWKSAKYFAAISVQWHTRDQVDQLGRGSPVSTLVTNLRENDFPFGRWTVTVKDAAEVVCVLLVDSSNCSSLTESVDTGIRAAVHHMSNDYSVQFAIGELVNDPLELPKSYQAARKALNREDSGTPSTTDRHTHRKAVRVAMSYIDERLHVNIGTSDIAAAVYMTPNHLMNVFKADTGMTIHEYLEQRRMRKAREMLSNPMYRTYEVAYACGYADPKYFSRVFKKRQGMSPTDYREKSASSL